MKNCIINNNQPISKEEESEILELAEKIQSKNATKPNSNLKKVKSPYISATTIAIFIIPLLVVGIISYKIEKKNFVYSELLEYTATEIVKDMSIANEVGTLLESVWYNSSNKISDPETDKYTKTKDGVFIADFHEALTNMFNDEIFESKLYKLRDNENIIVGMKALQDAPNKFKDSYEVLKQLYKIYIDFTELIINPNSNYETYKYNFYNTYSKATKYSRMLQIYFE